MVTIMAKTLMAVVTGCMAGTGIGILIQCSSCTESGKMTDRFPGFVSRVFSLSVISLG